MYFTSVPTPPIGCPHMNFLKKDLPIRIVPTWMNFCISVVNHIIEKTKIRMLEEEALEPIKTRCEFSFKRIVKKNDFFIFICIIDI